MNNNIKVNFLWKPSQLSFQEHMISWLTFDKTFSYVRVNNLFNIYIFNLDKLKKLMALIQDMNQMF